ncbi:NAD synthase [Longilinea arvoryzae]|uniref:NH(3)-dependent NAD(+) synthetase n=1 Tax=Longilinea arvoryzae TaxID=360412 RepID=A0A0K8MXD0_9CHLR|nr:NAD(+) synthase [Longilinea arvoryzae]GAP15913.1 NAD synthase [Longilinea arvoryzae]
MTIETDRNPLEWALIFDPQAEIERISTFIQTEVARRGARGVLTGLSGGLDSSVCAYLCARALPIEQVHVLMLPERDSDSKLHEQAHAVVRSLGLRTSEADMTSLMDWLGLYDDTPQEVARNRTLLERWMRGIRRLSGAPALFPWVQEYAYGQRRGLAAGALQRWMWRYAGQTQAFVLGKLRARMLALSLRAARQDCLLVCTTDRSEWSIGFYDPHGDGVGDLALLSHLFKTQIRALGRELGLPESIITQPSSGDLAAGLPNEEAIGMSYELLDHLLVGLSLGMSDEAIALHADASPRLAATVRSACALADARRGMPVRLEPLGRD